MMTAVHTDVERILLTVGVFNIERFGYDAGRGHHRLRAALEFLLRHTPTPPDILAFPEARNGLDDGQRAVREMTVCTLSPHLRDGWYEPLHASRNLPNRRNHLHLLVVNTSKVQPMGFHDPMGVSPAYRDAGFAPCHIAGHRVMVCCEHWSGGEGRAEFVKAVNRVAPHGGPKNKTLLLGDFNADSSWPQEHHHDLDWQDFCETAGLMDRVEQKARLNPWSNRWEVDTRQLDRLRGPASGAWGYRDMGEEFGDPTPTTPMAKGGLRVDRIFRSTGLPATVLDYGVAMPPEPLSDHAYVWGTYLVDVAAEPDPLWDALQRRERGIRV
jgi:endonuclease/exonuclease/phosphatase family metal-dependent hydrolase